MFVEIATEPIFFVIMIVAMMAFVFLSFEIGMMLAGLALFWLTITGQELAMLSYRFFSGLNNFILLAVPFFILVGEILNRTGMTKKIMHFANVVAGKARGGLAHANVIGSMIFGGIQGAAMADVATLGTVFIPEMEDEGYPTSFAAAITATSSLVAPLIPPSIMVIIFGVVCGISIGGLLVAALVPGLLIGLTDTIIVHLKAGRRGFPRGQAGRGLSDVLSSGKDAVLALIAPLIILFGITMGVFTPAESGAAAAVYALFIGVVIYRTFGLRDFYESLKASVEKSAMVFIIIGFAISVSWLFARFGMGDALANTLFGFTENPIFLLGVMCIFLLFVGTWLEGTATIYLLGPVFWSALSGAGIHPLHFGVVFMLMLNIALITPPIGVCLFVARGVSGASYSSIIKEALPFLILDLIVVAIIIIFPEVVLFLPRIFGLA